MSNLTTKGIQVSVRPNFLEESSYPDKGKFVYAYHVKIHNKGFHEVQLLNRHWIILDANNQRREVRGPGVIGVQPIIGPGESHSYDSFSVLQTPIGKMYGLYEMKNLDTNEFFEVRIPPFRLIASYVNN